MHSMTSLCTLYPSDETARRAVEALRATGVGGRRIQVLTGRPLHDIRDQPVGTYAGSVGPNAPVGTYGGRVVLRRQGAGSYAGDPDRQRQGCYSDSDHVVIITYMDGTERARLTGRRGVRRLLRRAALDDDTRNRALDELAIGHSVVLVDVGEISPSDAEAQLEQMARAA
jgi:hypothetical protein